MTHKHVFELGSAALHAICFLMLTASLTAGQTGVPERVRALELQVAALQQQMEGQEQQIGNLVQRVTTLENAWQDASVVVDCAAGQTVAAALSEAARRTGRVTITVVGTCTEAVTIRRNNTTLRGAAVGDGLQAPTTVSPVVHVAGGARGVTLSQLTVTGGLFGVRVGDDASVVLLSSLVTGSTFHGIFVADGTVDLRQSTVDDAGGAGVFAWVGSTVKMNNSVIRNSIGRGLELQINATAQVGGGSLIADNHGGVGLWFGAVLNLQNAVVEGNTTYGVSATGGSTVLIGTGTVIRRNTSHGLNLHDTSVAGAFGSAEVTENDGWGVFCSGTPAVAQLAGALGVVNGNAAGQSNCP